MALLPKRIKPPAELRKALGAAERFLAIADSGAATIAATPAGLWIPTGAESDGPGWRRVYWDLVVKATWTDTGLQLMEGEVDEEGIVTDRPALLLRPAEPRNLPPVVRTRVERSIARWEQVRVPGGTGRVIGRRRAGEDGLRWTARLDSATPDTAEGRAVLVAYLAQIAVMTPEQLVQS
jgi:hypothetical protein